MNGLLASCLCKEEEDSWWIDPVAVRLATDYIHACSLGPKAIHVHACVEVLVTPMRLPLLLA